MRFLRHLILLLCMAAVCVGRAAAQSSTTPSSSPTCPNSGFLEGRAITDLCWDCFFPLKVIGVPIGWGSRGTNNLPDDTAAPICVCPGKTFGIPSPGITIGYWDPEDVIELVRNPWCSPMLGFQLVPNSSSTFMDIMGKAQLGGPTSVAKTHNSSPDGFYNFHWIRFPGGLLIDELMDIACTPKSGIDMDFAYVSEIDPTWHSDVLSLYTAPESELLTQIYTGVVCMADGVAATVRKPILGAWWCAGTWGKVYPMDGNIPYTGSFNSQMLAGAKGLAHMHRLGLAKLSYGDASICQDSFWFTMPHQQYQFQNFWPVAVRDNAYWLGTSEYWKGFGISRQMPVVGEDRLIMQWQYRECCLTIY